MKVEYRKVYKDLEVGGESHKVGDDVLTLPEHNTETEVAVGTDMGINIEMKNGDCISVTLKRI